VYEAAPRETLDPALIRADEALYLAKRSGRDQVPIGAPEGLENEAN
jgi:PleD family two-component response regulator